MTYSLQKDEEEIFQVSADSVTVLRTKEATGKLVLTNKRLLFVVPIFGVKWQIPYEKIENYECYKVAYLFPFGVKLNLKDGETVRYAVRTRTKLLDYLNRFVKEKEQI